MQPNVDFSIVQAQRQVPRAVAQPHYNIVVAGEFNAGKSSVINLLLRQQALPASVGFSEMPPTKIFPSDRTGYTVLTDANAPVSREDFLSGAIGGAAIRSARVELNLPDFRGAAITEVSVGLDGQLDPEMEEALHSADLLIWCTMAQRAWCLTEIAVIESLPEHVLKGAILAVTRADYLRGEGQREMVQGRLEREAKQYFDHVVLLDASEKSVAQAAGERAWVESGGQALFDRLMARFRKSEKFGRDVPVAKLQDLDTFRGKARKPAPAGGRVARSVDVVSLGPDEAGQEPIGPAAMLPLWAGEIDMLMGWVEDAGGLEPAEFLDMARDRLRGFVGAYLSPVLEFEEADKPAMIAMRGLFEARTAQLEGFARRYNAETAALLAVDLMCQIGEEMTRPQRH